MYVLCRSGKKHLTIMIRLQRNLKQMKSAQLWIRRLLAGKELVFIDLQKKDMADSEAGSGKEQRRKVTTKRMKMDL